MIGKSRVEIRLMGDNINLDRITTVLGVAPTKAWKKGDREGPGRPERQYDCWCFSTELIETFDSQISVNALLDMFYEKREVIRSIVEEQDIEVSLDVILVFTSQTVPSLTFEAPFVEFAHCIKGCIDVDMYCEDSH